MSEKFQSFPAVYVDVVHYPKYNTFVAECLELPVVVEAETLEKVEEKMNLAIKGFLETFPQESKIALGKTRITVPVKPQSESISEKTILKIPIQV
jgi:hypothetical protein